MYHPACVVRHARKDFPECGISTAVAYDGCTVHDKLCRDVCKFVHFQPFNS